jgi:hypothetical protein
MVDAPAVKVKFAVPVEAASLKASAGVVPVEQLYARVPVAVCRPDDPEVTVGNAKFPAPPELVIEQFPWTVRLTLEAAVAEPAEAAAGSAATAATAKHV